ncbi:class I SAM-dependent methyltransferase [Clostridium sp. C2-6-12]|uniref:class I SAM-dependent methyltransferase n=1 Tax=Clostridium sp. C2-6-12 TaxID=2698832 RepID=UPI00136A0852|nr:class I SAM-dependent methyltransferase [Clostridium sp. C2-6-12]
MKQDSSTKSWNQMVEEWIELAQKGESRIHFIMPYMLGLLGDVKGKCILDLGCGEGGYSRELAKMGAEVTVIDCSEYFIDYSKEQAQMNGLNIMHYKYNSNDLCEIQDNTFDIVLCSMMLMDCEDLYGTIKEVARVLKPAGKFFVSILHPCFNGNYEIGIVRQGKGINREVVIKNYFQPAEWEAPLPQGKTSVIWRHRTLEEYVKAFIKCGLTIVDMNEPRPTDEQANVSVPISWLQKIPLFLFWELKK